MPDFENNEIQDSAFPVEFNDENEALDMYGVWVKSGPRDISAYDEPSDNGDSMDEQTVIPVFDSVPDITEFDELPDFDIGLDELDNEGSDTVEGDMEEILPEEIVAEDETAEPADKLEESVDELEESVDELEESVDELEESVDELEESVDEDADIADIIENTASDDTIFEDLPDFDISLDGFDDEGSDTAEGNMEEILPEEIVAEDETAEPADKLEESADKLEESADELEESADEDADIADIIEDTASDDTVFEDLPDFDISLDEFDDEGSDTAEGDMEEILPEEIVAEDETAEPADKLEESADELEESADELEESADKLEESADELEESADELEESADELEESADELEESADEDAVFEELPDFDISLDEFVDETEDQVSEDEVFVEEQDIARDSSAETPEIPDLLSADDSSVSDEVDLSAFLEEFEASAPSPAAGADSSDFDSLDLDDFINEINESGGSSDKDKEKLFEDAEPVAIDLEFDEEFIENSEKIRAAGSGISEPEFESSEFGVEFVDETTDDFDSGDFDAIEVSEDDESGLVNAESSMGSDLEEATEFDDLLASLDDVKPSVDRKDTNVIKQDADFNLMVTEEDGLESIVSAAPDTTGDDEDVSVPLFAETENETDSDTSFDIDMNQSGTGDEPEEIETLDIIDSDEDGASGIELSSDTDNDAVIDFGDDIVVEDMEIVEKDNLDITEDSDYNELQSGADSVEGKQDVSIDFDDVGAFEESLHESGTDTGEYDVTSNDKSTELLMLIAEELSSIKKELSSLNTELATVKKAPSIHDDSSDDKNVAESGNTGFFSDDDTDEAIALTGDELNNILITADFTEEKNDEPVKDEDISLADVDDMADDPTVADLSEDFSIDIPLDDSVEQDVTADFNPPENIPEQEISFDDDQEDAVAEEHDIPEVLSDEVFGTVEDQPIEVTHVNKIEDDISYLDGDELIEPDLDDVAIDEPEIETLDFNDEHLEEPELTEFNIDLSDMEHDAEYSVGESADVAVEPEAAPVAPEPVAEEEIGVAALPLELKNEIKSVLSYMDQLLESLPEDKIEEFARSEHFDVYKKLFEELGIS